MDLWTEYEGKTIAGDYTLASLLRSEGRSAFFRIGTGAEQEAVLRLTEAHFDQDEMLKRWRQVAAVEQDNLIAIRSVGYTTIDGVALAYAVLEPSDAALAEVLAERPLTVAETTQVARSVVSALSALHSKGLVHEHVEAANVLAVGETVKLRSDCVRECVIDQEFSTEEDCQQLRQRDVRDVGLLLLQCLTLAKEWQPGTALPQPFTQIVPRALDGSWGLAQIASALDPPKPAAATALVPETVLHRRETEPTAEVQQPGPAARFRPVNDAALLQRTSSAVSPWLYVAGIVLLVLVGWHFLAGSKKPLPKADVETSQHSPGIVQNHAPPALPGAASAAVAPAVTVHGWRVVAFTYNHADQAAAKVAQLARRHASLQPQVFSPRGGPPYFVALGGAMSSGEAESVLHRARQAGLPRDTFMRNF